MLKSCLLLALLFSFIFLNGAFGYVNVSISEEGDVYRAIDKLIALRLISKAVTGHRPWSRKEVAALVLEADQNLPQLRDAYLEVRAARTLKYLKKKFAKELAGESHFSFRPFEEVRLGYLFLDSPRRNIPVNVGTNDQINAFINPLTAYQRGRPFGETHNANFEFRHFLDLSKYFSIVGRSQFLFSGHSGSSPDMMEWDFDELYLRSEFKNVGIQIGRDQLAWGPTPEGGVFHSTNAKPLDLFKISNIHPFHYPWILKFLGPSRFSCYFSVLESNREHDYAYLTGWKFSFLPWRNFELGLSHSVMGGGQGGISASFWKRFIDLTGPVGNLFGAETHISNRVAGPDFVIRFPGLRGLTFYYEFLVEDHLNIKRWDAMFLDEAMQQVGLFFPRLNRDGSKTLRAEFLYSGFRTYRHQQYTSGWTHKGRLIGNELGPDAYSASLTYADQPTSYFYQRHTLSYEVRDNDQYTFNGTIAPRKTQDNLSEYRWRWVSAIEWKHHPQRKWEWMFGYERVKNFNFVSGDGRNNFLFQTHLTIYPFQN